MKYYAVFAYYKYYPSGGMNDFKRSFSNLEDAEEYSQELENEGSYDYVQVVNLNGYL